MIKDGHDILSMLLAFFYRIFSAYKPVWAVGQEEQSFSYQETHWIKINLIQNQSLAAKYLLVEHSPLELYIRTNGLFGFWVM